MAAMTELAETLRRRPEILLLLFAGYFLLQTLDVLGTKLDDFAAVHIDEVIVVWSTGRFIARGAIGEDMTLQNSFLR